MVRTLLIAGLPFVILVVSPQRVTLSLVVTAIYVLAAVWLRNIGKAERLTILFAAISAAFLALSLLRAETVDGLTAAQRSYAVAKALYMIAVVLPLSAAVAVLVKRLEHFRLAAVLFLLSGLGVSLLTVGLCNPSLFGAQRYAWQGNLAALAVLIALQFWAIPRFWPAVAASVICLIGVTAANSRQSVVAVAAGLVLTAAYWFVAGHRRGAAGSRWNGRAIVPVVVVAVWLALLAAWTAVDLRQAAGVSGLNWVYNPAGQCGHIAGRFAALAQSTGGRSDLLAAGLHQLASSPLFGTGLGSFVGRVAGYEYPHNVPLEVSGEMGLLGVSILLAPFLVGWGRLLAAGIRLRSGAVSTLLLVVLIFAASSSFSGDLPSARPLYIFGMLAFKFGFARSNAELESEPLQP